MSKKADETAGMLVVPVRGMEVVMQREGCPPTTGVVTLVGPTGYYVRWNDDAREVWSYSPRYFGVTIRPTGVFYE